MATSNFEAPPIRIVITFAIYSFGMGSANHLINIEREEKYDRALVKRLAKIMEALSNIED